MNRPHEFMCVGVFGQVDQKKVIQTTKLLKIGVDHTDTDGDESLKNFNRPHGFMSFGIPK